MPGFLIYGWLGLVVVLLSDGGRPTESADLSCVLLFAGCPSLARTECLPVGRLSAAGRGFFDALLINDKLGHPEGDRILCLAANLARHILRDRDVLGRFGGEEFVAFLPDTTLGQAAEVAERLREAIEDEGTRQPMPLTMTSSPP